MIILGALLVAVGAVALLNLPWAPALLIGLGAGMVVSGVTGRMGWPSDRSRTSGRSRAAGGERVQPG